MVRIEEIVAEVEAGAIYKGKVTRLADFGAFVAIVGNKEGLVHISQIAEERVEKVSDYLQVGQEVTVKVVEIDRQGRIRLTRKILHQKQKLKQNLHLQKTFQKNKNNLTGCVNLVYTPVLINQTNL